MNNSYKRLIDLVLERRYNTLKRQRRIDYGRSARRAGDRSDSPVKSLSPEEQEQVRALLQKVKG